MTDRTFLEEQAGARPLTLPGGTPAGFKADKYYLGQGQPPLEVAVVSAASRPTASDIVALWKRRHGNRPSPLLLVILHQMPDRVVATLCGPQGDSPTIVRDLELGHAERLARAALVEPNRHAAVRFLVGALGDVEADLPGLRNEGLLATHELRSGVFVRRDWVRASEAGRSMLERRGRDLVEALGFTVEARDAATSVLRAHGTSTAVAVFLDEDETYEGAAARFSGSSPVTLALANADADRLPYVVITRGPQIRLYVADKRIVGVGRKGRTETYIEANLLLLPERLAGYLPLIFGADALSPEGSFEEILESSRNFAAELSRRLRERVYMEVVPQLAEAIARRSTEHTEPDEEDLAFIYEEALFVLFRLVFIAYAEDRELLPYATNQTYRDHALSTRARRLAERWNTDGELTFDEHSTDLWSGAKQLFRAVDRGNSEWGVPAYDGGLFSSDPDVSRVGAAVGVLELTNSEFGPALAALLVDMGDDGVYGAIDFRSLSVREFGTIYEGLLESSLALAKTDLALDRQGTYIPARPQDEVVVPAGQVYLHNRSGARKSTGSYFTKPFAVEHLLNQALEPALGEHLRRISGFIEAGDEVAAAEELFDFRVADIAMGSGHFLVDAVDHIEARMSSFLAKHPLPAVSDELERLRLEALRRLGDLGAEVQIEQAALIRRLVARRCIYGVDVNPIAVELARLALWIHTFVPGLPLSFLDRTLVCGNSLTGIGTLEEAAKAIEGGSSSSPGRISFAVDQIEQFLARARIPLQRLGRILDATPRDIKEAREAQAEATEAVKTAASLFDLAVAARLGEADILVEISEESICDHEQLEAAAALADSLQALHFPVAFPEVFLRGRSGFDCIIGNPPWDKLLFEPQQFWVIRSPGLNALPAPQRDEFIEELRKARPLDAEVENREREARELMQQYVKTAYTQQGRGHYDCAKLFVERALRLLSPSGPLGYVLPRQALVLGGWSRLRQLLISKAHLLCTQARNRGGWLFEDVDHRYMVVLVARLPLTTRATPSAVEVWPAVESVAALNQLSPGGATTLTEADLGKLSDGFVIPWFEEPLSGPLFMAMCSRPRLSSGDGWITGAHDSRWDFRGSSPRSAYASRFPKQDSWRILMTRHVHAFSIQRETGYQQWVEDPSALVPLKQGIINAVDGVRLGNEHPTIVFRHPSRNDDSRTIIAAALEERGEIHNTGYVHAIRTTPDVDRDSLLAFLAYLNTMVCDWWARRIVDRHVTAPIINNLPLPDWGDPEVILASEIARELLIRRGAAVLPGGYVLDGSTKLSVASDEELVVSLELLASQGFDLREQHMTTILADFSGHACPDSIRKAVMAGFA